MELSKKNLIIISTLVLVVVLVLFNLEMFTGDATRQTMTTAQVTPSKIKAGDYVRVQVTPGARCADKKIKIYKEGKPYLFASFEREKIEPRGGSRFCNPTVAVYKSWASWEKGNYYVMVKDIASNKDVKVQFSIE